MLTVMTISKSRAVRESISRVVSMVFVDTLALRTPWGEGGSDSRMPVMSPVSREAVSTMGVTRVI